MLAIVAIMLAGMALGRVSTARGERKSLERRLYEMETDVADLRRQVGNLEGAAMRESSPVP
jgi:hypothetical protein